MADGTQLGKHLGRLLNLKKKKKKKKFLVFFVAAFCVCCVATFGRPAGDPC